MQRKAERRSSFCFIKLGAFGNVAMFKWDSVFDCGDKYHNKIKIKKKGKMSKITKAKELLHQQSRGLYPRDANLFNYYYYEKAI